MTPECYYNSPEGFWARVYMLDTTRGSCWEWTKGLDAYGYGQVNYRGKKRKTHRLAWEFTYGPVPQGLSVLHRCDNRKCVNPFHLFLGVAADNVADAARKGRMARGEAVHGAKLTQAQVGEIVAQLAAGATCAALGRSYGVSRSAISSIKHGQCWKQVLSASAQAREAE